MKLRADTFKLLEEMRHLKARAARTIRESMLLRLESEHSIGCLHKAIEDSYLLRFQEPNGLKLHQDFRTKID